MRNTARTIAAATLTMASLTVAGTSTVHAAQSPNNNIPSPPSPAPTVQMLACDNTTGPEGCGPGWYWRNGARGWACYPCN